MIRVMVDSLVVMVVDLLVAEVTIVVVEEEAPTTLVTE
jgi:hypothetical protein